MRLPSKRPSWPAGRRACGALAVAWLLLAPSARAEQPAPVDAGAPGAADAGPDALDGLRREVAALRRLVSGELPDGLPVSSLFEVSLGDADAVSARAERLRAQVAELEAGLAADAGDGGPPAASDELRLQLERQQLRLTFLSLSEAARGALLREDERRRQLSAERSSAEAAELQARADERRAEEARRTVLAEAGATTSRTEELVAAERARVLAALETLSGIRAGLARRRTEHAARSGERLAEERRFAALVDAEALEPAAADAAYAELVAVLTQARKEMADLLAAPQSSQAYVPLEAGLDPDSPAVAGAAAPLDELRRSLAELRAAEEQWARDERELAARQTDEAWQAVDTLNSLRLRLLPRLSPERRDALLGLTPDGLAQLRRELEQLVLTVRWYPRARLGSLRDAREQLREAWNVGAVTVRVLEFVLLVAFLVWARPRWRPGLRVLKNWTLHRIRNPGLGVSVARWFHAAGAVGGHVATLGVVYAVFELLEWRRAAELDLLRALALGYAWYALVVAGVLHLVHTAVAARRIDLSEAMSERVLRSLRLVGRYALAVVAVLVVAQHALGRGYLYALVVNFSWVGAVPISLLLLRHWRADIARAYVRLVPQGALAAALGREQGLAMRALLVVAASAVLIGRGLSVWVRDTFMRFDQTRKALAFLFRRKLEKQADAGHGREADQVEELPGVLRDAFSEEPVAGELRIDREPHLAGVLETLASWREGGPGAAWALVGERGIGKTSWLDALAGRLEGVEVVRLTLTQRLLAPAVVVAELARVLGVEAQSVDALVDAVRAGPRRVLLVDQGQNLMLRAVNGLQGYEVFTEFAARTAAHQPLVCAFSRYAFEYLEAVTRGRNVFREVLRLEPWTEQDIALLVERRMAAVHYRASYQDLLVDRVDGTAFESEVIRTGQRYLRLLWDYADGNPRVAVHFWIRSLAHDAPGHVRVRLFEAPSADELERLGDQARFVLASTVTHENVDVGELCEALRFPVHQVQATCDYLRALGILELADGRLRVTTHWNRAVLRILRRKHLLYS